MDYSTRNELIKGTDFLTHESHYLTVSEVAALLSVSEATIRNWVKTGKLPCLTNEKFKFLFAEKDVIKIKSQIDNGTVGFLKNRRNKTHVKGQYVPDNYVSYQPYLQLAFQILELSEGVKKELVLYEVALKLLCSANKLDNSSSIAYTLKSDMSPRSLTEMVKKQILDLEQYRDLLAELYDIENSELSEQEIQKLRQISELDIPFIQGEDFLGLIYTGLSCLGDRKMRGSYYTPHDIVQSLVKKTVALKLPSTVQDVILNRKTYKAIDPCCGSGNFLISLFIELKEAYMTAGLPELSAEEKALASIYGLDIDKTAVSIAKINIFLLLQSVRTKYHLNICNVNTLELDSNLINDLSCFDLILGNPPWGYDFSEAEIELFKNKFHTPQRSLESFVLFIEAGLNMLKPGGILAYVLPEAILNVKSHQGVRSLILNNSAIEEITHLGQKFANVFAPAVTIIMRKYLDSELFQNLAFNRDSIDMLKYASQDHKVNICSPEGNFNVPQLRFVKNDSFVFNINADYDENSLLEYMRNLPEAMFLKDNAEFALGIVTGNNKDKVLLQYLEGGEIVLKGNDLYKYNYYPGASYIIFDPSKFQQAAPEILYREKEKLIYRFINENLVFAYDDKQTLSLNSANVVIPRLEGYSVKYVLAVLNSRPAQFFHSLSFSSVKVLRKHIESIPIPACKTEVQDKIKKMVNQLIDTPDASTRESIYEELDTIIMNLYRFSTEQRNLIRKRFAAVKFLSR